MAMTHPGRRYCCTHSKMRRWEEFPLIPASMTEQRGRRKTRRLQGPWIEIDASRSWAYGRMSSFLVEKSQQNGLQCLLKAVLWSLLQMLRKPVFWEIQRVGQSENRCVLLFVFNHPPNKSIPRSSELWQHPLQITNNRFSGGQHALTLKLPSSLEAYKYTILLTIGHA